MLEALLFHSKSALKHIDMQLHSHLMTLLTDQVSSFCAKIDYQIIFSLHLVWKTQLAGFSPFLQHKMWLPIFFAIFLFFLLFNYSSVTEVPVVMSINVKIMHVLPFGTLFVG